jgi:hypothetical protein
MRTTLILPDALMVWSLDADFARLERLKMCRRYVI